MLDPENNLYLQPLNDLIDWLADHIPDRVVTVVIITGAALAAVGIGLVWWVTRGAQ